MQKGPLWWAGHHVNHHKYADRDGDPHSPMVSGFYWWEYDLTWYTIRAMAAVGLVWDIQPVPDRIYDEARAVKVRRAATTVPSVVDAAAMPLELAEEPE